MSGKNIVWGMIGIITVIALLFGYNRFNTNSINVHESYDITGSPIVKYDAGKEHYDYETLYAYYNNKIGKLDKNNIASVINKQQGDDNANSVPLKEVVDNNDRMLFKSYTITGKVVKKVRITHQPYDFMVIDCKGILVRVYYYADLPPHNKNSEITITGVVLGRQLEHPNDPISLVSTERYTK